LVDRTVMFLGDRFRQERQRLAARELLNQHCNPQVVLDATETCYADMMARRTRLAA